MTHRPGKPKQVKGECSVVFNSHLKRNSSWILGEVGDMESECPKPTLWRQMSKAKVINEKKERSKNCLVSQTCHPWLGNACEEPEDSTWWRALSHLMEESSNHPCQDKPAEVRSVWPFSRDGTPGQTDIWHGVEFWATAKSPQTLLKLLPSVQAEQQKKLQPSIGVCAGCGYTQ